MGSQKSKRSSEPSTVAKSGLTATIALVGSRGVGLIVAVDAEDLELLAPYRWYALPGKHTTYAYTIVGKRPEKRTAIYMHRLVMGASCGTQVDHIDGNGLNDCKSNLRTVNQTQNNMNQSACRVGSSRFKGVRWHKRGHKWAAQIKLPDKAVHLGLFTDELDAARAYNAAAIEHFGAYCKLNEV